MLTTAALTIEPRRRLGPRNRAVVSPLSVDARKHVAVRTAWAALPRAASAYALGGLTTHVVNRIREDGGALAQTLALIGVADAPEEIEATMRAAFLVRTGEAKGTLESLRECARRDAYAEAEDRVTTTELIALLESDAPTSEKLAQLAKAKDAARADAAQEIRKLAEYDAMEARLIRQMRGGRA
jgi:hypothetical protein